MIQKIWFLVNGKTSWRLWLPLRSRFPGMCVSSNLLRQTFRVETRFIASQSDLSRLSLNCIAVMYYPHNYRPLSILRGCILCIHEYAPRLFRLGSHGHNTVVAIQMMRNPEFCVFRISFALCTNEQSVITNTPTSGY